MCKFLKNINSHIENLRVASEQNDIDRVILLLNLKHLQLAEQEEIIFAAQNDPGIRTGIIGNYITFLKFSLFSNPYEKQISLIKILNLLNSESFTHKDTIYQSFLSFSVSHLRIDLQHNSVCPVVQAKIKHEGRKLLRIFSSIIDHIGLDVLNLNMEVVFSSENNLNILSSSLVNLFSDKLASLCSEVVPNRENSDFLLNTSKMSLGKGISVAALEIISNCDCTKNYDENSKGYRHLTIVQEEDCLLIQCLLSYISIGILEKRLKIRLYGFYRANTSFKNTKLILMLFVSLEMLDYNNFGMLISSHEVTAVIKRLHLSNVPSVMHKIIISKILENIIETFMEFPIENMNEEMIIRFESIDTAARIMGISDVNMKLTNKLYSIDDFLKLKGLVLDDQRKALVTHVSK